MRRLGSMLLITGFVTALLCANMALADDTRISVQPLVDRATALIGDRIKFTVEIKCGSGIELGFPEFKDGKIGSFEIKDSGREVRKYFFGAVITDQWYLLAAYSTGKLEIPPLDIKYKNRIGREWQSLDTHALKLTIESVLPKGKMPSGIKDIKGPVGYFEINWVLIIAALALIGLAALALFYIFRKKPAPVRLPHESALEELEAARGNFMRNSDVKEYYAGISDCVRRYIERLFRMKAPEMTTEEFLGGLRESTVLSLDQKDLLKDFLNACDMVKFAKYTPAKGEMESVFLAAKKFIEETKEMGNVHI